LNPGIEKYMLKGHLNKDESAEHFKAFFEYATMGIVVTNRDGHIIAINPFASNKFGYSEEELIGKRIETLIPQRFYEKHVDHRKKYGKNQQTRPMGLGMDLWGLMKDGTEFPVEVSLGHYTNNGNNYVVAFINDISVRKMAEAEIEKLNSELENSVEQRTKELQEALLQLEKSNETLENLLSFRKTLLDTAGAIIIATDVNGTINLFNPEAVHKLGYSPAEILDKENPLLFHDKREIDRKREKLSEEYSINVESDFEVLVTKARRGIHEEEQYNYVGKTGNKFPVSLTITALRDAKGAVSGYMGIAVDVSERIKAENKLRRAEHLFLQLLHNYPDGIISIIDRNYRFVYTGGELHKQLKADIGKLIGQKIYPFFPEPLRAIILSKLEIVFRDKVHITGFELPFPVVDGNYIMDAFPLIEDDGPVDNIGVIIKNISELKQAELSLREDLKIEKDLNELKSRFVSMASHEFRTPLSTVLSSAYLIGKYTSEADQSKRDKHLLRIISSVNMLTDILDDFLNLGKIEEGKLQARFSEFNLREMIEMTIDEIKNNLKKDQQISYYHEGDATVFLDATMLKHILMNLISNASKFSPEASSIELKSTQDEGCIKLSVKDNGIGISNEDKKHLMERFFRGANAQNIQGTGLGLSIVSKYVEMMNGNVRFESELDKGTEFTIIFNALNE